MARHPQSCLALLGVLALAAPVAGCKVSTSASSSSANDAKPDSGGRDAKPDSGGGDSTLTPVPAKPAGEEAAADPSGDISAGNACADAGHAPGDSWKDACNTCNCTDTGEVVCTRMHCGDDPAPH